MEKVTFNPAGIAKKQHELYGLDDTLLQQEAEAIRYDIAGWSERNFLLDDQQLSWLASQDDSFTVEFARTIADGVQHRYDINIFFQGPEPWKSKRISARKEDAAKTVDIFIEKSV